MKKPGVRSKRIADAFLTYAILLVVSVVFLFPCLWLVLSCFSESGSIYSSTDFSPPSTHSTVSCPFSPTPTTTT